MARKNPPFAQIDLVYCEADEVCTTLLPEDNKGLISLDVNIDIDIG